MNEEKRTLILQKFKNGYNLSADEASILSAFIKGNEKEPEFIPVYVTSDNDGHKYIIPMGMKDEFDTLLEKSGEHNLGCYEAEQEFIDKFSKGLLHLREWLCLCCQPS